MKKAVFHVIGFVTLYLLVCGCLSTLYGQYNLVPNPSFEQYTNCPSDSTIYAMHNNKPDYWYKPDKRAGSYLNACTGSFVYGVPYHYSNSGIAYQPARTGVAYIAIHYLNGVGNNSRNYFQVQLNDSLRSGKCYYGEFYVALTDHYKLACNNHGLLLTKQAVYADTAYPPKSLLIGSPQVVSFGNPIIRDSVNWTKVSAVFVASGGEMFLTVGNFKSDANTIWEIINPGGYSAAAYYIDDVSVIPLDSMPLPADAGPDRTITFGDSTYIGSYTSGINIINWYNSNGAQIATGVPGLKVSPAASTFYVVEHTVCGNYSRDTVYVSVQAAVPLSFLSYNAYLKNGSVFHRWSVGNEVNVSHYNITRSYDGGEFKEVGTIKAGLINGQYSFVELVEAKANAWYRIEGVDYDGKKTYSNIINLKSLGERKVLLMPNPATDVLTLSGREMRRVVITDITGNVVANSKCNSSLVTMNVAGFAAGIYMVQVTTTDGTVEILKFIKE